MTTPQEVPAPTRERGWRLILLALVAFLLVPAVPQFRVLFPLEQTILLVGPAIAACALLAWLNGGRVVFAVVWIALAVWMLARPLSGAGAYDMLARGWAVLLVAVFGVLNLVGGSRPFLSRALSTLAVTFGLAITVVLVSSVSPARVQRTLADEIDRRTSASAAAWNETSSTPEWQRFAADHPTLARLAAEGERRWRELPNATLRVFPALLALESLAALALAWGLFHRMSRTRIGRPLAPFREFRFADQLIWGLLAGIAVLVLPGLQGLRGLGLNLVVFFGALYALRGLAVLAWFIGSRRLAMAALVVLTVIFWPFIGILSLGVGLGDTWIDWRGRVRQVT
jgi:hypothetical protein